MNVSALAYKVTHTSSSSVGMFQAIQDVDFLFCVPRKALNRTRPLTTLKVGKGYLHVMAGQVRENAQLSSKVGAADSLIDKTILGRTNSEKEVGQVFVTVEIPHPTQFFTACHNPPP